MRKRISDTKRAEVLELTSDGWTKARIALATGLCEASVYRILGAQRPKPDRTINESTINESTISEVRRLSGNGLSHALIAAKTGICDASVPLILAGYSVLRQRGRPVLAVQADEVQRLGSRHTNREIARRLNIGKSTVQRILAGQAASGALASIKKPEMVASYECPGCDRRVVYVPCVICAARGAAEKPFEMEPTGRDDAR